MIAYRCLTSNELLGMINDQIYASGNVTKGQNTFKYERNIKYRHFFVFAEHADYYRKLNKRDYPFIGQYIIPNEKIEEYGFGFYGGVKTMRNDGLYGYYAPLPEVIINQKNLKKEYLYKLESMLYMDFTRNELDNNDNKKYDEPVLENYLYDGKGKHGINGYLDYSYADIYYEMIYQLSKKNDMNMYEVAKKLKNINLYEEIEKYFEENVPLFEKQTNKYLKLNKKS